MIQILWATVRPFMFIDRHKHWMENKSGGIKIHTLVAVNTETLKKEIEDNYDVSNLELEIKVTGDEKIGICKPIYELTKNLELNDDDIIIVVCDDVNCIPNWDEYLVSEFKNWNGAIMIRDGYQHYEFDIKKTVPAVSMPTMTFECLKKINKIIFHPDYFHYFSDNELYLNLTELELMKDERSAESVIFEHIHYSNGKRTLDDKDQLVIQIGNDDRATYHRRLQFSVEKRIQLNIEE